MGNSRVFKSKLICRDISYLVWVFVLCCFSGASYASQRLIVRFDEAVKTESGQLQQGGLTAVSGISSVRRMSGGAHVIELAQRLDKSEIQRIKAEISQSRGVVSVEKDLRYRPQFVPGDPDFSRQWYLADEQGGIDATTAWDFTAGDEDTIIAVLDTGIVDHSDFAGRYLPGYDFVSDLFTANDGDGRDSNPADPGDAVNKDECDIGDPEEDQASSWHGTLIAGLLAANTNNDIGIAGIDHHARVLPVRVLGKCGGFSSDVADAIRWAAGISDPALPANPYPAHIINLSFGGEGTCTAVEQAAIDEVVAAGVLVVVAAGNAHVEVENYAPANCDNVLVVAASTREGGESCYTNFGEGISLSAPGGNRVHDGGCSGGSANGIYLASNAGLSSPGGEIYEAVAGTSFAAPMVSGVAGLVRAVNPTLTPADIQFLLESSARDFPVGTTDSFSDCEQSRCGYGLLDAYEAVQATRRDALLMEGDGSIQMLESEVCLTEDNFEVTLSVTRSGGSGAVAARIITEEISATPGDDFGALDTLLAWGDNENGNKQVSIPIFADNAIEGAEFFNVRIQEASSNAQIGVPAATMVTIISTDGTTLKTCATPDPGTRPPPQSSPSSNGGGGSISFMWLLALLTLLRKKKSDLPIALF